MIRWQLFSIPVLFIPHAWRLVREELAADARGATDRRVVGTMDHAHFLSLSLPAGDLTWRPVLVYKQSVELNT